MAKIFLAPSAVVAADVVLEDNVNIWHGAVLRGDSGTIHVGANTNIQDNCVLHEAVTIGRGCSIGHGAILHGCTVADDCVIGMGAILLDGATLGKHCLVGAGAVVTGKTDAPEGSLLLGNPAKVVKPLTPEQIDYIHKDAENYLSLAKTYLEETSR